MIDVATAALNVFDAYNAKDFDRLESLLAPDIDVAHFNRDFAYRERASLMALVRRVATELIPDRRWLPPERVIVSGRMVVCEGYYTGTATTNLPGIVDAGGTIRLKFCSVMRFDDRGIVVEWKDYG